MMPTRITLPKRGGRRRRRRAASRALMSTIGALCHPWPTTRGRDDASRCCLAVVVAILFLLCAPAAAVVGGATVARNTGAGRHIVMIVSTRGNLCAGTALTRDLVLTAAHCVAPAATYRVLTPDGTPPGLPILSIAVHPRYNPKDFLGGRVTADVALLKLESPLPGNIVPVGLASNYAVKAGDRLVIAGYGVIAVGNDEGAGTPRQAALVATGRPGNLQIRLVDPTTRGQRAGLGACTGDSGGPAFTESGGSLAVVGVISWSTGPNGSEGCGGLTGVTPLALYRKWIIESAKKMGSLGTP